MNSAQALCALDPIFAPIVSRAGPFALPARAEDPYTALITAVAGQQLHARAAQAILGRFTALHPPPFPTPAMLLATDDATMRACGFSAAKTAALRAIATGAEGGQVPTRTCADALDDATLIADLTRLRGVGRWTVEMMLIFTLGRPDILPVDDFAIREGWRLIAGDPDQPRPKALAERGRLWAPYRTTASWYLWRAADEAKVKAPPGAQPPALPRRAAR